MTDLREQLKDMVSEMRNFADVADRCQLAEGNAQTALRVWAARLERALSAQPAQEYDRELICKMLRDYAKLGPRFTQASIERQCELLEAADNASYARTVSRPALAVPEGWCKDVHTLVDFMIDPIGRLEHAHLLTDDVVFATRRLERLLSAAPTPAVAESLTVARLTVALQGMIDVYEELHARYDIGDCDASVLARQVLAEPALAVPEGFVLVPREPTPGMLESAGTMSGWNGNPQHADTDHIEWWAAMIAAAPHAINSVPEFPDNSVDTPTPAVAESLTVATSEATRVPIMWRENTPYGIGYSASEKFYEMFPSFPNPPCPEATPHCLSCTCEGDPLDVAIELGTKAWEGVPDSFVEDLRGEAKPVVHVGTIGHVSRDKGTLTAALTHVGRMMQPEAEAGADDASLLAWLACGGWEVMQDPRMWPEELNFRQAIAAGKKMSEQQGHAQPKPADASTDIHSCSPFCTCPAAMKDKPAEGGAVDSARPKSYWKGRSEHLLAGSGEAVCLVGERGGSAGKPNGRHIITMTKPSDASIARAFWEALDLAGHGFNTFVRASVIIDRAFQFDAEANAEPETVYCTRCRCDWSVGYHCNGNPPDDPCTLRKEE